MSKGTRRFETIVTMSMAVVALLAALVVWRAAVVNSDAHTFDRKVLIDTIRARRAYLEDLDLVYQEARYAIHYETGQVRIQELASAASSWKRQGKTVLGALAETEAYWYSLAAEGVKAMSPMAGSAEYRRQDGSLDLEKRLKEIQAENPDLRDLAPEDSARNADRLYRQSRLLLLATIPLAFSLVGLTAAQVLDRRGRYLFFALGIAVFLTSAVYLALVELAGLFI